ncbi:ABC transporter permease [Castellaniella sp.]|uniref:ABC transporter permease n=1 Tax=Castellaniella sp. TaxID=1955812 RepID=UPI0035638BC6
MSAYLHRRQILQRLVGVFGTLILTFIGLTATTFAIGRFVPVDPVAVIVGDRASPEAYQKVRAELGLDKPVLTQYANYLGKLVTLDLGQSLVTRSPVSQDLAKVFPATFELASLAMIIGVMGGIPLGVLAAQHKGDWVGAVCRVVALPGYSTPIFWLGMMALVVFYVNLGWASEPGRAGIAFQGSVPVVTGLLTLDAAIARDWAALSDALFHLALPSIVLGYASLAYISRMTRSLMLDQLGQEFVLAARAKGASESRVIWRHVFPNILVPLVTVVALAYAQLLEGAVLTETVFSWPGLGQYMTTSLFNGDLNSVLGATVLIGAIFISVNLLSDILYRFLDPRTRV